MKKFCNGLALLFVAGNIIAGCGYSRGRTVKRKSAPPRELAFSPIRFPGGADGVEGATTPGGTQHIRVMGLAALAHAATGAPKEAAGAGTGRGDDTPDSKEHPRAGGARRSQVFFSGEDAELKVLFDSMKASVPVYQKVWIETYSQVQALSNSLEELRIQALWRYKTVCEAVVRREPIQGSFVTTATALKEKYAELKKDFLPLREASLGLGMSFLEESPDASIFERVLISDSAQERERKQADRLLYPSVKLECVLDCSKCHTQILWGGLGVPRPMCCGGSLLILLIRSTHGAEDFDWQGACSRLAHLSLDVKALHEKITQYLEKLVEKKK